MSTNVTAVLVALFGLIGTGLTLWQNRKLKTIDHNVNSRADKQDQTIGTLRGEIDLLRNYISEHPTNIDPVTVDQPPLPSTIPTEK